MDSKCASLALCLSLGLSLPAMAESDPGEPLKKSAGEQLFRPSAYSGVYLNKDTELEGSDGAEFGTQEFEVTAPLYSLKLGKDWRMAFSTRYRRTDFDFSDSFSPDYELHNVDLSTYFIWKREGSPWQAFTSVRTELAGDFVSINDDSWGATVISTFGYEFSKSFAIGGGFYAGREFGEYRIIPALGILWDITDTLRLELLPPSPKLIWIPDERWQVKLGIFPGGGSWGVSPDDESADTLNYRSYRAGLGVERQLVGKLWINGWVGANLFQSVELEKDDDRVEKRDIDTSLFGYVGVRYFFW